MELDSKLIPVIREGVNVVKMIFFRQLLNRLQDKYIDRDPAFASRLTGAVVNELFGTPNQEEPHASFASLNRMLIETELKLIATEMEEMRIPLTDGLRSQFLCDSQEGFMNKQPLTRAKELGILLVDRDLPLPHHFMSLVRNLGESSGILIRPVADA